MMVMLQGVALEAIEDGFIPHSLLWAIPPVCLWQICKGKPQTAPLRFQLPYEKLAVCGLWLDT